ncbi:uncharacterized protein PV07_12626 [Cladophialophora immunda]|uniref:Uncharacterized protein n=1 Tax=Cladophialophora immunda TaxID=569365 RepID=A0A0D1Z2Y2_9EURO|nr:uncharacterized protein PV07_12626 [Cladophialophora immunda]KIW21966.1 hypothetical protein PV07_12626 [Cladophialophora immunda]
MVPGEFMVYRDTEVAPTPVKQVAIDSEGNTASIHDNYDIRFWQAQKPDSPLLLDGSSLRNRHVTCVALDRGIAYIGTSKGEILILKWQLAMTQKQPPAQEDSVWGPTLSLCQGNRIVSVDTRADCLIVGSEDTLFIVKPLSSDRPSKREVARVTLPLFPRGASIQIVRVVERDCRQCLLVVAHDPRQQKLYILMSPWEEGDTLERYWNYPFSIFSYSDDEEKRSNQCKNRSRSLDDVVGARMATYQGTILFLRRAVDSSHDPPRVRDDHWVHDVFTARTTAALRTDGYDSPAEIALTSAAGEPVYVSAACDVVTRLWYNTDVSDGRCVRVFSVKDCSSFLTGSFAVILVTGEADGPRHLEQICRSLFQGTSSRQEYHYSSAPRQLRKPATDGSLILAMPNTILLAILERVKELLGPLSARRYGAGPYESYGALRLTCRRFWDLIQPRRSLQVAEQDFYRSALRDEKTTRLLPIYALRYDELFMGRLSDADVDKFARATELDSLSLQRVGKNFLARAQRETLRRIRNADLVDIPLNLVHEMSNLRYLCWTGDTQTTLPELLQLEQLRLMIHRPRSTLQSFPSRIFGSKYPKLTYAHIEYINPFDPANIDDGDDPEEIDQDHSTWNDPSLLLQHLDAPLRTLYVINAHFGLYALQDMDVLQSVEELYIGFSLGFTESEGVREDFPSLKYLGIIVDDEIELPCLGTRLPRATQVSIIGKSQVPRGKSRETSGDTLRRMYPSLLN